MQIGVPYDLFFRLTPKTLEPFIESYQKTQEQEQERINYNAWLNGWYVRLAVASALSKKAHYPAKPIADEDKEESEKDYVAQRRAFFERFNREHPELKKPGDFPS